MANGILTKSELLTINRKMLGKGAPMEVDNLGYNKIDYSKMINFSNRTDLTNAEALMVATTLSKYTKTQLTNGAEYIRNTFTYYQKLADAVKIVKYTKASIQLAWRYNRRISHYVKIYMDRTQCRWLKPNGEWVLEVQWDGLNGLLQEFNKEGFNTSEIMRVWATISDIKEEILLKVSRPATTVDTLTLEVPYKKVIVETIKSIPYRSYNKDNQTWEICIEYAEQLYTKLNALNIEGLDLSQLQPWAELVKGWEKSYRLMDVSECNLKFTPYDFQIEDAKALLELKTGLNANDMGCGKTFEQVIIGESIPMKKLVICPPTLRLNWKHEILHVNPKAEVNIIYSNKKFEVVDGWNIIGYNSLDKFLPQLEAENFQVIMIDEAHYIQAINNMGTPASKRAHSVLRLAATAQYVYPITGTPKTSRNKNLFNILRIIRHPLARGQWAFSQYGVTYCDGEKSSWGWNYDGNSNDNLLNEELKPHMIRHLKKEVLPHLKKQRIVTPVEVDLREYNHEIMEYLNTRTNKNAENLARLMRARKTLATQKVGESIDFAKDLIACGEKVVVVTCFTEVVKAVEQAFKGNVVKLVGGMNDIAKDKAIQQFQTGKPQVMVMNIVAGGVGVTLTKAYNMVINDFDWTPGNLTQAEDRICRSGQTEEFCNIYYLYASGADIDEVFAGILTNKFNTINATVDGGLGDSINYLDLVDEALEKSTGIKKVRKIIKVKEEDKEGEPKTQKSASKKTTTKAPTVDYSLMTVPELEELAKKLNVEYKHYDNPKIYRMRLVMALKKVTKL